MLGICPAKWTSIHPQCQLVGRSMVAGFLKPHAERAWSSRGRAGNVLLYTGEHASPFEQDSTISRKKQTRSKGPNISMPKKKSLIWCCHPAFVNVLATELDFIQHGCMMLHVQAKVYLWCFMIFGYIWFEQLWRALAACRWIVRIWSSTHHRRRVPMVRSKMMPKA